MTARRTRAPAALVAAALIAAALATAAAGAESASGVRVAEASDSRFPDMAFVLSLPRKQPLTAADLRVTENGVPPQDVKVSKPGAEKVGVVLLIDASNSMLGRPIASAMIAARTFAERRNPGQQLALVTFNSDTTVVLPLTSDSAAIGKALAQAPPLAAGTHIYDALERARVLLESSGISAGSIVLLSDGKDVGSTLDQKATIAGVKDAKMRVFAVGLRSGQYDPDTLRAIAEQTAGTYTEAAGTAALNGIFSELGYTLLNEYLLRYRSLAGPSKKIRVAVQVAGFPGRATVRYVTPALPAAAVPEGPSAWDHIIRSSITLFVVLLLVISALGFAIFRIVYRPEHDVTQRIGQFVTLAEDEKARERQEAVKAALAKTDRRSTSSGTWQRLENDMAIAGIETPIRTVAILTAIGGLVLGVLVAILLKSPVGLLAIAAAPFVTRFMINTRLARTRRTFADQLPDNLDVLSSGLRSGHSFTGALAVCVDDAAEPSKAEFRRVIADEQLGVPIDEALHITGRRMKNRDIVQIALVAKLQREAGTNAADVLDQVGDNVRARLELRRLIAALTAQGRMARWIVSLLPVFLFFAIYLLNRGYLEPLWTDPVGIAGLVVAVIMIIAGSLVIKRIVNIEV